MSGQASWQDRPAVGAGCITTLSRWSGAILVCLLLAQVITHSFFLSISAHSGQVALPWMMNRSMTLFDDLLEQHAPGTSVIAAVFQRILPFDPLATVRLLDLALLLVTSVLVYSLARRLLNELSAVAAVLFWALWQPVYGNVLFYFDSFLGSLVMLAIMVWLTMEKRGPRWFAPLLAGVTLGAATVAKQYGWVAVVLFAIWMMIFRPRGRPVIRDLGWYVGGVLVFPSLSVAIAAAQGNLDTYIYWNWLFNFSVYVPNGSLALEGGFLRKLLLTNILAPAFWLLALPDPKRGRAWQLVFLMWLACSTTMFPRPGEIHVMGHLPLLAVMSGVVIASILEAFGKQSPRVWFQQARTPELVLMGILLVVLVSWAWAGVTPYIPGPLGYGGTPAYTEFEPLVARLRELSEPGDTLYVLPETDSTPQVHVMSGLLPPGTWVKGWSWYLQAPGVVDTLLTEWQSNPPDYIVIFPQLVEETQPYIDPLVGLTYRHYEQIAHMDPVVFHGEADIYRLSSLRE